MARRNEMEVIGATAGTPALFQNATRMMAAAIPNWAQGVSLQGSTHALTPDEDLDPLPFVVDVLTSTKLFGAAVAWPQRPFRGERLLMSATYIPAAASPFDVGDLVVITPAMFAGAAQVGASQGDTPISAYSGKNFGVRLSFPPTGQGSRIYIPFVSNLPITAGDSIIVTCTLLGGAVR